jgi:putative transposase
MAKPPRDHTSFGSNTYFVTSGTAGKRFLFQADRMAALFLDTMFRYRQQGKFLLHEFVVMPDHFHVLLTPAGISLERTVQLIKGGFSYRVKKERGSNIEVWSRGYVDHRIRDENDYQQHVEYIRQNPVEAGIVSSPEEYPYSSAHEGFELDACPQGLKPGFKESA